MGWISQGDYNAQAQDIDAQLAKKVSTYPSTASTLVGIWSENAPNTHTITYNWGSGVTVTSGNLPNAQNITSGTNATIDIPTVQEQEEYTFLGWSETERASSATYKTGNDTIPSVTQDHTLYAVWARTVLYDSGTLVINELPANRKTNATTAVYEAMQDDGSNYVFSSSDKVYWYNNRASITSVEIGSNISPMSTAYWFYEFTNCLSVDLTKLNTSAVKSMAAMFYNCSSLISLDLNNFDTSNVTSMGSMFYGCSELTSLDLSSFATSNVTSMDSMFYRCSKVTNIIFGNRFDTSKVTSMFKMFQSCKSLTRLDLGSFDTSSLTSVSMMFDNCSGLTSLSLGNNFNTSKVTNLGQMFNVCSKLQILDLSSFDTSNVTGMNQVFDACSSLTTIYVRSSFVTDKVAYSSGMFTGCTALIGGQGTQFNSSNVDVTYARIDGGPGSSTPGYFTQKP